MHVMLDLETLSTAHNAAILSIGAVKFDPLKDTYEDLFHVGIDPKTCQALGLNIDADTVMWWMQDDRADARKSLAMLNTTDLASALEGFASWLGEDPELQVWGNAPTFDCTIMRSAYKACQMETPWGFWQERCFRTMKMLAATTPPDRDSPMVVMHDALHDALHQTLWLQKIYAEYPLLKA